MAIKHVKSMLTAAAILATLVVVSFLGGAAFLERSVYITAIERAVRDEGGPESDPLSTFVSRPIRCELRNIYVDKPIDPIFASLEDANVYGTEPISLTAAQHLVPVLSQHDNLTLHGAGYNGNDESDIAYVSRVGFNKNFSRAAICLKRALSPHGFGIILVLERSGIGWDVVRIEESILAI